MKYNQSLDIGQWKRIGRMMKDFQIHYWGLMRLLEKRKITKQFYRKHLEKINYLMMDLKCDLEDMMAKDCPNEWTRDIFYGITQDEYNSVLYSSVDNFHEDDNMEKRHKFPDDWGELRRRASL